VAKGAMIRGQDVRGVTQKFGEFKHGARTGCRMLFPPLGVASIMLCESVCQQLSS
jgi:hypothetical protein